MKGFLAGWLSLSFCVLISCPGVVRAEAAPICFLGAATADSVNIRSAPSEESPVVGRVWQDVGFRVSALQSGWFRVEAVNGNTGWIRCDYVKTVSPCEGSLPAAETAAARAPREDVYRIQVGDELAVKSFRFPELEVLVTVRPDGYISLILLDDIYVRDKTLDELDSILTEKYREHFRNPDVTVLANEIQLVADSMVFIGGEVNRPMERALQTPITALQAIVAAGGFKVGAKARNVMLIRKGEDGKPLFFTLDLSDSRNGKPVPDDVYLQPYDVVYVPATAITKAGDFVDQYINRIVPQAVTFGVNWLVPTL